MNDRTQHIFAVLITAAYLAAFILSAVHLQRELSIIFGVSTVLAVVMFHNHSIYEYKRFPFSLCRRLKNWKNSAPR